MIILGLHMGHDASMALIKGGKLLGTSSVERFTRIKKDSIIDKSYLELFLKNWEVKLEDVDLITFSTWTAKLAPFMQIYSPKQKKNPLAQF